MKKYVDELLQEDSSKKKLPLCVQKMKSFARNQSPEFPVKLVYGEFYNAAIEVKRFYKPVSKIYERHFLISY
ncbi:MAG: hypothetical protein IPN20_20210 [Haliscomenobacter sp.]|nr:hypothetical protein [Haliscomenobacter sp.]MBK8656177.1 hypothetical protein [Haliscomenobacter sp.]